MALTFRATIMHSISKNKTMPQKTIKNRFKTPAYVALALLLAAGSAGIIKHARAATCSTIAECTAQINDNNQKVADLQNQAVSYQDAIQRLQSQIGILQGAIGESQRQQAVLEQQITEAQNEINRQKSILGEDLRTMYIDGQMSTIEALATSNDLSDYIDKQEYRNAMQSAIQKTLKKIGDLQAKLQTQKQQVSSLLAQQQQQAAQVQAAKAEQDQMLAMNNDQQAQYNAQTADNKAKLNALIAAQRAANAAPASFNSSGGGYYFIRMPGAVGAHDINSDDYPYRGGGFSMSTAPGCNDGDGPDRWGYCTRQCVSYAAWAVERSGRAAPKYWGDAASWPARARAASIPVYGSPQPGDVAISTAGYWGHAMYVEAVSGSSMLVSQYNQSLTGSYSTQWRQWQ